MTLKPKAVILLSGGLDSAYNLWKGQKEYEILLALTMDYGQRAAKSEQQSAAQLCAQTKVTHQTLSLSWFHDFTRTGLVQHQAPIPTQEEVEIHRLDRSLETAKSVWVPNRNGIFLNIAAAYAEGLGADTVLVGFNAEEAQTFPDNSVAFQEALNQSLFFSTANHVHVKSFCLHMNKTQIVEESYQLNLPLDKLWPCYFDGPLWCGQCESCLRFKRALRAHLQIDFKSLESQKFKKEAST